MMPFLFWLEIRQIQKKIEQLLKRRLKTSQQKKDFYSMKSQQKLESKYRSYSLLKFFLKQPENTILEMKKKMDNQMNKIMKMMLKELNQILIANLVKRKEDAVVVEKVKRQRMKKEKEDRNKMKQNQLYLRKNHK